MRTSIVRTFAATLVCTAILGCGKRDAAPSDTAIELPDVPRTDSQPQFPMPDSTRESQGAAGGAPDEIAPGSEIQPGPELPGDEEPQGPPQAIDTPDFLFLKHGPLTAILQTWMPYQVGSTSDSIIVPRGFVTDFASIPRQLWPTLSPVDDYKMAAIVHDYLYWYQPCERVEADNLLYIAMTEDEVPPKVRNEIWTALRVAGDEAWRSSSAARDLGVIKIVPARGGRPRARESWQQFHHRLWMMGVRGTPGRMPRQHYCEYGKSRRVP